MSTTTTASELLLHWQELRRQGKCLSAEELCADCPELTGELRQQIRALESMEALLGVAPAATATADDGSRAGAERPVLPGYEVVRVLDQGGMGVVYQARQRRPDRLVALKMILAGVHAGPLQLARFRDEAEAVARLQHPNIVPIYEVDEHDGRPYFTMEYLEGGSLADRLKGTPQPPREAAGLVETLARAIHCAHEHGVIHRDLKPANVLLAADGTPKVADFGLAKRLGDGPGRTAPGCRTQTGAILGTPSYMAPEQAEGRSREIGPAVDIHALGAILYELLTGRPPFRGETTLDTLEQVRLQEPVPPRRLQPKVPRDLETVCLKCLEKEPTQRYASAAALADDLRRFLAGEPIRVRPTSAWERGVKWARRRPAVAGLILVSVLAALTLLGAGAWFTVQLRAERDHARQEQERARRERDEADRQRARAEAILRRACEAVDENAWSTLQNKGAARSDGAAPGSVLYNLATVYSLASASTRGDTALAPDDRDRLAEQYAARAVELLGHSQAAGYFGLPMKLQRLKEDRDFDPLRERGDFRLLLAKLEKKPPAGEEP